jgi:hypothetical protein
MPKEQLNKANWSIQDEIQKRANLESNYDWANRKEEVTLPRYTPTEAPKLDAGVWNMAMNLLNQLKP